MICPRCGAEMVLRIARRGRNAGSEFYGCSNYPTCKYTVDVGETLTEESFENLDEQLNTEAIISKISSPKYLYSREKYENYNTVFLQTITIPEEKLLLVNSDSISRKRFSNINKWRVDYPINYSFSIDDKSKEILLIASKILKRGRVTLSSPQFEKNMKKVFNNPVCENIERIFSLDGPAVNEEKTNIWFDGSGHEKYFYEEILFELLGNNYKRFVLPQIKLSSLIHNNIGDETIGNQRVDFLITLPSISIVVEIDDDSHKSHKEKDNFRDNLLRESGFHIIRINLKELYEKSGENFDELKRLIEKYHNEIENDYSDYDRYLMSFKYDHQIQLTLIEAYLSGYLNLEDENSIMIDRNSVIFEGDEFKAVTNYILKDFNTLIENIIKLYQFDIDFKRVKYVIRKQVKSKLVISYNENIESDIPRFIIADISFPYDIAQVARGSSISKIDNPAKNVIEYFLNYIFRKEKLWEGQYEAISRALSEKDAIVLLPTGSGKSIAYQLASILRVGVSIIIDPILSLIGDQIDNLQRIGIDNAIGITSEISSQKDRQEIIKAFSNGQYMFCYIAPERFQTKEFRQSLKGLVMMTPISLIAIDEAHCISEWGHDFRTSYLNLGRNSRKYCSYDGYTPPLLALTGTASNSVLRDVQRELQIEEFDAIITPSTFDRKELKYSIKSCNSSEKDELMQNILLRYIPDKFITSSNIFYNLGSSTINAGIVFCPHVNGEYGVVNVTNSIKSKLGINANFYSGSKPKFYQKNINKWNEVKKKSAHNYKNNKFSIMVATKSFGMGIDKSNVRFTVHYGIPASIESFYQEAGRSGRDKKNAECVLLVSNDDVARTNKLLDVNTDPKTVFSIVKETKYIENDDITRALWFHSNSYRGVKDEFEDICRTIDRIKILDKRNNINLTFERSERNQTEKSIHRLLILGIIEDYTIDYSSNEFNLLIKGITKEEIIKNYSKYVFGYNRGRVAMETSKLAYLLEYDYIKFIKEASKILIEFIYDTIEKGRRRALKEMVLLSEEAQKSKNQDSFIREGILRYLESTYDEEIERIIDSPDVGFEEIKKIVNGTENDFGELMGGIRSPKDAKQVRGQVARYLESYPDHPGLLILRSLSEILVNKDSIEVAKENVLGFIEFSKERYDMPIKTVNEILFWYLTKIYQINKNIFEEILKEIMKSINDIELSKKLMYSTNIDNKYLHGPISKIFRIISDEAVKTFEDGSNYDD